MLSFIDKALAGLAYGFGGTIGILMVYIFISGFLYVSKHIGLALL